MCVFKNHAFIYSTFCGLRRDQEHVQSTPVLSRPFMYSPLQSRLDHLKYCTVYSGTVHSNSSVRFILVSVQSTPGLDHNCLVQSGQKTQAVQPLYGRLNVGQKFNVFKF
jgi:hypothetical protein